MADVFDKAYSDADELVAELRIALEREGVAADHSSEFCDAVGASTLIGEGRGIVAFRLPSGPPGESGDYLHMLVPVPVFGRGFVFNGKKAVVKLGITAAGTLLGGPIGFLAVLQNLVGYDFAVVEFENGMVCNLATLLDANTPMSAVSLAEETTGKACIRPKSSCRHRQSGLCDISVSDVEENLTRLEERMAVERLTDAFRANRL